MSETVEQLNNLDKDRIEQLIAELKNRKPITRKKTVPIPKPPTHKSFSASYIFYTTLLLIATLSIFGFFLIQNSHSKKNPHLSFKELLTIKKSEETALAELTKRFIEQQTILEELLPKEPFYGGILKELSRIIPDKFIIHQLIINKDNANNNLFQLSGSMPDKTVRNEEELTKFVQQFNTSPFFNEINLSDISKNKQTNNINFTLNGKILI